MYWFRRPHYLRWLGAALAVSLALWLELRPQPATRHPFAAADLAAGAVITSDDVVYQPVPAGVMVAPPLPGVATVSIAAGEPLLASTVGSPTLSAPAGWWALEVALPSGIAAGTDVRLVLLADEAASARAVPGRVLRAAPEPDALSVAEPTGWVAVPEQEAVAAAAAGAAGRLVVLVAAGPGA